jgi:hypothetical protein
MLTLELGVADPPKVRFTLFRLSEIELAIDK